VRQARARAEFAAVRWEVVLPLLVGMAGTPNARKALFEGLTYKIEVFSDGSVRETKGWPSRDRRRLTTARKPERFAHSQVWWT
jgi:hypothetical protein